MNCSSKARCMERRCKQPADCECEGCGEEMCFEHLTQGLCDLCVDSYLGLDAPATPLPHPTTYRSAA